MQCILQLLVVRRSAGPQLLSIGPGCDKKGIIMHELMHAAGFWHEQSRTDRNKYVEILWENVAKGIHSDSPASSLRSDVCASANIETCNCLKGWPDNG